jgi:hypothetical protein
LKICQKTCLKCKECDILKKANFQSVAK